MVARWWDEYMQDGVDTQKKLRNFVADKLDDLTAYDVIKEKIDQYKVLMDNKEMTTEDFISVVSNIPSSGRQVCPS
jgi:hypothetical protein